VPQFPGNHQSQVARLKLTIKWKCWGRLNEKFLITRIKAIKVYYAKSFSLISLALPKKIELLKSVVKTNKLNFQLNLSAIELSLNKPKKRTTKTNKNTIINPVEV